MTMRWRFDKAHRLLATVAGLVAAVAAGPVQAHDAAPRTAESGTDAPKDGKGGGMIERMAKHLDLTADQQARIKALNEAHWAAMKPKHEAQEALVKELQELVKTKAADSALTAKLDALKAGRQEIQAAQQAHQDAVAAILTPRQKAKFVLWMVKKMEHGEWKEGKGGKDWKDKQEGHEEKDGKDDDD